MNRSSLLLLTVGGLAIGVLVGWALAPKAAPRSQPVTEQDSSADAPQQPAEAEPQAPAEAQPVEQDSPAETSHPDAPDVAALLASLKADAYSGDGQITGGVWLQSGEPLPGVQIRATPYVATHELPPDASLADEVKAYAQRTLSEQAGATTAQTNAQGDYRLTGLDSRHLYRLEARLEGYVITQVGRIGLPIEYHIPRKEVYFTAKAAIWIVADVRMPDGSAPDVAQIGVSEDLPRIMSTNYWHWRPEDNRYALQPGSWILKPRGGEHSEAAADPIKITVAAGDPERTLVIQLTSKPGIAGTLDVPGQTGLTGRSGIGIDLLTEQGGAYVVVPPDRSRGDYVTRNVGSVRNNQVRFHFLDLEPGQYRLAIKLHGAEVLTHDVTVSQGVESVSLKLPEPDRDDFLVVSLMGPDGPLDENVRFGLHVRSGPGSSSTGGLPAVSRGNGEHWIARASIRRREGATYTLSVTTSQGVTQTEFDPESREVLRLSLSRPAFVTVRIEGYEDHPNRADFVVDVRKAGSEPPQGIDFLHRRMMGDENQQGRRHGPYEPGEYSIALLLTMDTPPYAHVLESAELALAAGDNTITLTAPALHSVTVEIPKEYRTDRLELRHMHDGDYYVRQRNSGSAEFKAEGLKPGVYHLSDGSTGAMRINIPADSGRTIPFNPQPFDAVWIVGRMMGRQDPDFALKSGDVVHSIDGKTIASVKEFYDAISAARKNESAMCVLSRGGVQMTVTFNPLQWTRTGLTPEGARLR